MAEGDPISDNTTESPDSSTKGGGMSFTSHLEELRNRLIYSVVFLVLGCIVSFIFIRGYIFPLLVSPWENVSNAKLQALGPTEQFMAFFKVGFATGLVIAMPFILHQLWLFLKPGLRNTERRWVKGMFVSAFFLFLAGCAFCFYLVLPISLAFLLNFQPGVDMATEIVNQITLDRYFSFALFLTLAGGFVFQIPLITLILSLIGLVTPTRIIKFRRYALLFSVILAAALTPTGDPITLSMLAIPIYLLYEVSIIVCKVVYKSRQADKEDAAE